MLLLMLLLQLLLLLGFGHCQETFTLISKLIANLADCHKLNSNGRGRGGEEGGSALAPAGDQQREISSGYCASAKLLTCLPPPSTHTLPPCPHLTHCWLPSEIK